MIDFETTALLVIDVQEDFLPPNGSLAVADGREIIPQICKFMDTKIYPWKTLVVTKDWHPNGHISFASSHEGKKPFEIVSTDSPLGNGDTKPQVLWPDHCVQGSHGSEFPPEVQQAFDSCLSEKKLVLKGYLQDREYYSCFMDIWGVHHTECEEYLRSQGVKNVIVVGIAFDYCVLNSSVDAARADFDVTVLRNLTRAVDPTNNEKTEALYAKEGVKVSNSDSIIN